MNTSKGIRQIMLLLAFALVVAATAMAAEGAAGERYIVILKSRTGPRRT